MSGRFPASAVATGRWLAAIPDWRAGLAAPALAAALAVLAPSGVTATIQADPVCLNVPAQPGTGYNLPVYATGSGPVVLSVTPAHGSLERSLHQVQPSWVRFVPDRGSPGMFLLILTVPRGAAPGAYWSDVVAAAASQPGAGAQADLGAAATTALVFTVGSSSVPPPCDALDGAQSTGQFPPWPTKAFATTGWKQVFASQEQAERAAHTSPTAIPTAGTGASAADPAPPVSPVADPAQSGDPKIPANWPGWLAIIAIVLLVLAALRKRSKS
jgi:hypothetical protein